MGRKCCHLFFSVLPRDHQIIGFLWMSTVCHSMRSRDHDPRDTSHVLLTISNPGDLFTKVVSNEYQAVRVCPAKVLQGITSTGTL